MKRIVTGILVLLMIFAGVAAILGSGGSTDSEGADRQWASYQSSRDKCKNWCYERMEDHSCDRGGFSYEAGLCTCDGFECE